MSGSSRAPARRRRSPLALAKAAALGLAHTWRRSLQLRVAATTMVVTVLLAVLLGVTLLHQFARGLLEAKLQNAQQDVTSSLETARLQVSAINDSETDVKGQKLNDLVAAMVSKAGSAGLFEVVAIDPNPGGHSWTTNDVDSGASVPADLRALVENANLAYAYGELHYTSDSKPAERALIVGGGLATQQSTMTFYYLFPLTDEERTLALIQRIVLLAGVALVFFVVAIAMLVTRQVVAPVRLAAETAKRLADGRLEERMQVRGTDDLALLAQSFNEMAGSLQQQIGKLEELSRLQRRFTSDVSHELRTPLTTIRMAADVLHASRDGFEPAVGRSAELLQNELGRFESLLADLLEISRYDAGVAALEADPVDMRGVVARVVDGGKVLADRQGSPLVLDVPDSAAIADVDQRRVERILRNLLGNAIEHGDGKPIEVTLATSDTAVAVTVRDHGVGLRPGEAALVFNRFWRADPSRARQTGGTGLGLAISLEDARLHGGWLHAWGRPGAGAQFRLTLPVRTGERLTRSPLPVVPTDLGAGRPVPRSTPLAREASEEISTS